MQDQRRIRDFGKVVFQVAVLKRGPFTHIRIHFFLIKGFGGSKKGGIGGGGSLVQRGSACFILY